VIRRGDLDDPRVLALLTTHVTRARAKTAHGSAHALDPDDLKTPDISFWTLWDGEALAGMGALRRLDADHGELKSMFTDDAHRGRGHGRAMVAHLVAEARSIGLTRLSLETGSWDYFIPARALYASAGFTPCDPFGDYVPDPNSVFMTMAL